MFQNFTFKTYMVLLALLLPLWAHTQTINFSQSTLGGETSNNPTSLEFGPDGRLYVAQQNGEIKVYTIERDLAAPGSGSYTAIAIETITLVKNNTPNHNDNGTANAQQSRQVTGLLVTGTPNNPVLYVTSSDWRIAVGNDSGLDTNSGVISRLSWNGSAWDKVDIVRGLPRCEENHAINGLDLDETNNVLYVMQGGHTNKGAPGNNFSGTPEYFFSGALLAVNLTQINSMPIYTDPRSNTDYVYDLPTLNDPTRTDIDNTHPEFPYTNPAHPMYSASIDLGDPFGGNNSLNQAIPEPGAPVFVFSPGYRNAYDILFMENGRLYSSDNGPNGGWGGLPFIYDSQGNAKGFDQSNLDINAGDYITNEFNDGGSNGHGDPLIFIDGFNYYGGHPAPIRAFPAQAGVIVYEEQGNGNWVETESHNLADLLPGVSGYFNPTFNIGMFPDNPIEAVYSSNQNVVDINSGSSNGLCEYRASNFGGAMQGDILLCSWAGSNIFRYEMNVTGDAYVTKQTLFSPGGNPLDVTAQDDDQIFPGTVWVATHGSDNIFVYEPFDFGNCPQPEDEDYVGTDDSDFDNYSNEDEVAVGTDHCNGGSTPADNDMDFNPDLLDLDDDNDGIPDVTDPFQWDPDNGLTTNLPAIRPFWNFDPGVGFVGVGFFGWMTDGVTDYANMYDENFISFGGAAGKAGLESVPAGTAEGSANSQMNGFQYGINVDVTSNPFTIHSLLEPPFFAVNGNATTPIDNQSFGIYMGTGDMDNYLEISFAANGGAGGIKVNFEQNGTASVNTYNVPGILQAGAVDVYIAVNPTANTAQPYYSIDDGLTINAAGPPITLPAAYLNPADNFGLAVGIIATSNGSGVPFDASWDFLNVTEDQPGVLAALNAPLDFETFQTNAPNGSLDVTVKNEGGPTSGAITISGLSFSGTDASDFSSTAIFPIVLSPGSQINIPITFTPDATPGIKIATANFAHTGSNNPLQVSLTAEVIDEPIPLIRVNAGGAAITASDNGPVWQANTGGGAQSGTNFSNNTGNVSTQNLPLSGRHSSIPDYISDAEYTAIFTNERWDVGSAPEMEYSFTNLSPGNYVVRLYMGNGYGGTSGQGERVFNIDIEGSTVISNLDLSGTYGHQVGVMLEFPVALTDGTINVLFTHVIENPLVNGLEILSLGGAVSNPIVLDPIGNQSNFEGDNISLQLTASGGDGNLTFSEAGLPSGLSLIQNTNTTATITGAPTDGAHNGSPYTVTIIVDDNDGDANDIATETFTWTISEINGNLSTVYLNSGGSAYTAMDGTNWSADQYFTTPSSNFATTVAIDNTTDDPLYQSERYGTFDYNIPVVNGAYDIELHFAEIYFGAPGAGSTGGAGSREMNVSLEGNQVLTNYDIYAAADANNGTPTGNGALYAVVETFNNINITDGSVDLNFVTVTNNAKISAICIKPANVSGGADLTINVELQGRTDYSGDYAIKMYDVNDNSTPVYDMTATANSAGAISMSNLAAGDYHITIKHPRYLQRNASNVTMTEGGAGVLNFYAADSKELRAGDTDDNNLINAIDFSTLVTTFNLGAGSPNYDNTADFNGDDLVNALDFSLLVTNFNTSGEVAGLAVDDNTAVERRNEDWETPIDQVFLKMEERTEQIIVGETFTLALLLEAGQQPIDAVEAHLAFDPERLEILDIYWNDAFQTTLQEDYDNQNGTIDLAAGSFSDFPKGTVEVAWINFTAIQTGNIELTFSNKGYHSSEVTFGGISVLENTVDSELNIIEKNIAAMAVNAYPVPTDGIINIEVFNPANPQDVSVRIFNTNGQQLFQRKYKGEVIETLDIGYFGQGVYLVEVHSGGESRQRRIVIE